LFPFIIKFVSTLAKHILWKMFLQIPAPLTSIPFLFRHRALSFQSCIPNSLLQAVREGRFCSTRVDDTTPRVHATALKVHATALLVNPTAPRVHATARIVHATAQIVHPTTSIVHATAPIVDPTTLRVGPTAPKVGPTAPKVGPTEIFSVKMGQSSLFPFKRKQVFFIP
jgi:hypothetical protein